MMLISPATCTLLATGSSYIYTAWASGTAYVKNNIRRYAPSGSTYYDYTCLKSHTSSSTITPNYTTYWKKGGMSSVTSTYTTNVRHSMYGPWTSGQAVPAWSPQYDFLAHRDYLAPLAISSGDNTTAPSLALLSSDPIVAARWIDYGAANAWAPYDGLSNSYLQGYGTSAPPNDLLASTTFSFVAQLTAEPATHIFFSGLSNVATVSATVTATVTSSGAAYPYTITQPAAQAMSLGIWGVNRRSATLRIVTNASSGYIDTGNTVTVAVTLTRMNSNAPAQCAVAGVGYGYELAYTEWGLESSMLDFSRKERDETFGTVDFIKRGSAKVLRATCFLDPATSNGDAAQYILQDHTGKPLMLDFNNGTSVIYDRLLVYGFYTNVKSVINAGTYEVLSMDVEGLVE